PRCVHVAAQPGGSALRCNFRIANSFHIAAPRLLFVKHEVAEARWHWMCFSHATFDTGKVPGARPEAFRAPELRSRRNFMLQRIVRSLIGKFATRSRRQTTHPRPLEVECLENRWVPDGGLGHGFSPIQHLVADIRVDTADIQS